MLGTFSPHRGLAIVTCISARAWNFNRNKYIYIQENAFANIVCDMAANFLSTGRWVKVGCFCGAVEDNSLNILRPVNFWPKLRESQSSFTVREWIATSLWFTRGANRAKPLSMKCTWQRRHESSFPYRDWLILYLIYTLYTLLFFHKNMDIFSHPFHCLNDNSVKPPL